MKLGTIFYGEMAVHDSFNQYIVEEKSLLQNDLFNQYIVERGFTSI